MRRKEMRNFPRLILLLAAIAASIFHTSCAAEKKESLRTRLMVTGESAYSSSNMNANADYTDLRLAKAAPRTPVEAGSLNVRSQVFLVVEVEAQPH
jgi:hypothetical protein